MSTSVLETKFQQVIDNNLTLVGEYNANDNNIPLEYCEDDVITAYLAHKQVNKNAEFVPTITMALYNAVKYEQNIIDSIESLTQEMLTETPSNSIQQYFKEIGNIYAKHNNDYNIEFCPENRDKLIEMNLKTVISVAKKYQGLGLSLQELISAGNYGLVTAFDKFDPNRSKLKDNVLDCIEPLSNVMTYEDLSNAVKRYFTYGDIKKKFMDRFVEGQTYTKKEVIKWVNKNIFNAKFNSIATMWIKAYILIEIDNYSRLVKKPKSEIYRDKIEYGSYKKEITLDIDSPISSDSDTVVSDVICIADDTESDLDVSDACMVFKSGLSKLLDGVKPRNRSIFLKKFGIGLPRPMLPKEIAEQEGLSKARVSQIFQSVVEQIQENSVKYNINSDELFEAIRKFK
jgi:DNA-directed RNA polymerase sigma subunit (sigma70/sigma32)